MRGMEVAGKHVGWRGGKVRLQEEALGSAVCLAERWVRREGEPASQHVGQPPALCAGARQPQHAGQEHRPSQLPQSTWHLIWQRCVSPLRTRRGVHACTSPCPHNGCCSPQQPACTRTSLGARLWGLSCCVFTPIALRPPSHTTAPAGTAAAAQVPPSRVGMQRGTQHQELLWECSPLLQQQRCGLFLIYIPGVVPQVGNCSS